eukprot:CAMPEP_0205910348 /NCGR_PEP_ID=MMETSP1325-20131115/4382_1 /ASSEMBLY_ACC=CAM_ASM_000708 /TAXON_ID=236786 /ORGANISM="Florenciella sp., Strain RCC1007" /LENGTH=140 /DNA_ID=CAMNT_0053276693 /DNA_START=68 /DNA_END=490 /DNA_ORIENTATION=+
MAWRSQLTKHMAQLTIRCCNTGSTSAGTRAFVLNNYHEFTDLNPSFKFMIREADEIEPSIEVMYHAVEDASMPSGRSQPECVERSLSGMSEEEVTATLKGLVDAGAASPQLEAFVPIPIVDALAEMGIDGKEPNVAWLMK